MINNGLSSELTECLRLGIAHIPSGQLLTSEIFNNEITISGTSLRSKQIWTVWSDKKQPDVVHLQNYLGRYLSATKDGKINAISRTPDADTRFRLESSPDGTGLWALKSDSLDAYLSGSNKQVMCYSKLPVWWVVRFIIHPQVHISHHFRGRYLRLVGDAELRADQALPWGAESVFCLEQPALPTTKRATPAPAVENSKLMRWGQVAIRLPNGKYLKPNGEMSDKYNDSVLYSIEFKLGSPCTFAFKDQTGAYLTSVGQGTVKCKPGITVPGKDEMFRIENISLQVGILANNGKFASTKQGVEISANQSVLDHTTTFKLEYIGGTGFDVAELIPTVGAGPDGDATNNPLNTMTATASKIGDLYFISTGYWRLRTREGKLWKMGGCSNVTHNALDGDSDSMFEMSLLNKPIADASDQSAPNYQRRTILRSNPAVTGGQVLAARNLGAVYTNGHMVDENEPPNLNEQFLIILDRREIVFTSLRTGAYLSRNKQNLLDSNGLVVESFHMRRTKNHNCVFFARVSDMPNSYSLWSLKSDGTVALEPTNHKPDDTDDDVLINDFDSRHEFQLHLLDQNHVLIQSVEATANNTPLLLRADTKGCCKLDEVTKELTSNYVWGI